MGNQLLKRINRMRTLSSANKQLKLQYSDFRSSRKRSEKEANSPEDKQKLCLRNELLISEQQPSLNSKKMRKQLSNQRVTNQMSIVAIQDVITNHNIKTTSKVKKNKSSSSCSIKLFRRKFCCF